MGLELEFTEGMQFDKGYISPYFVTDPERMEAVLEDAYILLHQRQDLRDRRAAAAAREGRRRRQAAADHRRGRRRRGAVDAGRQQDPQDVQRRSRSRRPASVTAARRCCRTSPSLPAAQVVAPEVGLKLDQVGLDVLGRPGASSSPRTTPRSSTAPATRREIDDRVRQIRAEIEDTDSDWDREKLQERLAKLAGGVGVIKVGAATEVELKEKKHRIEDAISATRAAIEEGIIAGGGCALVHAAAALDGDLGLTGDEATGVGVVRTALAEPLRWIAENAGLEGYVVVAKVADLPGRPRPQRRDRRVRRPDRGGRRRPGQGHPVRAAERGVDRRAAADHRDAGRREAGAGGRRGQRPRPRPLALTRSGRYKPMPAATLLAWPGHFGFPRAATS